MLQTENPAARIAELMKIREPLYRETADIVVDTNRRSPKMVGQEIIRRLEKYRAEVQESNPVESPGGEH